MRKDQDRRTRKTLKTLKTSLLLLLQKKSVKQITVRELAELADINRSTFYLHYRDIPDMVAQIQQELIDDFHKILEKYTPKQTNANPLPILREVFTFLYHNADFCKALLGRNGDIAFMERIRELLRQECLPAWQKAFCIPEGQDARYLSSYVVSGCVGVIQTWLENDMKEEPLFMASLADEMIMQGISTYHKEESFPCSGG